MQILSTVAMMRAYRAGVAARRVAFVPTMGALHAGHIALVNHAKQAADVVVVSIFVNRLQFGVGEDFAQYPRQLDHDLQLLRDAGVDAVFVPDEDEIHPAVHQGFTVEVPKQWQQDLCAKNRPGHFVGVATVVMRLLHIVQPDLACFGRKDYQQLVLIERMVAAFHLPVTVLAVPTKREADGLAFSSRNAYLSADERRIAPQLYAALQQVVLAVQQQPAQCDDLCAQARHRLSEQGWRVDYLDVRGAVDLRPPQPHERDWVIVAAAWLGRTRLIDNIEFQMINRA